MEIADWCWQLKIRSIKTKYQAAKVELNETLLCSVTLFGKQAQVFLYQPDTTKARMCTNSNFLYDYNINVCVSIFWNESKWVEMSQDQIETKHLRNK